MELFVLQTMTDARNIEIQDVPKSGVDGTAAAATFRCIVKFTFRI